MKTLLVLPLQDRVDQEITSMCNILTGSEPGRWRWQIHPVVDKINKVTTGKTEMDERGTRGIKNASV